MPRQFDYVADVEVFTTIAEHGTISAAAVALGTTPSVLSRAVARLETRLGAQLMRRTTRRLSLTDAGQAYLEQARTALAVLADAQRAVQGADGELTGTIRISAPTTYAHYKLPALLQPFMDAHPNVMIELSIANRNVDLVSEGFDMAVRLGALPDSGLAARKLGDEELVLAASPAYLARAGTPETIGDLAHHSCLTFVMPSTGKIPPWLLTESGADTEWQPPPRLRVTDDVLGVVSLARQGMGICQTYRFVAAGPLQRGELVQVLPRNGGRTRPFSLIYPPHKSLSSASRALISALSPTLLT